MSRGLYLYGILPAAITAGNRAIELGLEGLDQQPVQTQEINDFIFLYSEAKQEKYLASRKNLLGHERVLEQAMDSGCRTLLPLQFGLIINDWEAVKAQLVTPKGQSLKQLFSKLNGNREVSVKVFWEQDRELERLMQENHALSTERDRLQGQSLSMDQIVKIGQAIEAAMHDRQQAIIEQFRVVLNPLAIDQVENDPLTEAMIYNAAYLIPWDTESQVSRAIDRLDQDFEGRLRIRYNNFTAPFNFAQL